MRGDKRPTNCFRCWHCRRVDGFASMCVCIFATCDGGVPDLIYEPYRGRCDAFHDKEIEERVATRDCQEGEVPSA